MAKYAKVRLAAKLMIAKYGKAAPSTARLRARRSARQQDEAAVKVWASIARAAQAISRPREKRVASLSAVLGGPLRPQQFTSDDEVNRKD